MTEELSNLKIEAKKYFTEKIAEAKEQINTYKHRMEEVKGKKIVPTYEALLATGGLLQLQYVDILEMLGSITDEVIDLEIDFAKKTDNLDKAVQEIGEKTGVDISKLNTEVGSLKETIGPRVGALIQLLSELKEEQDKRKPNEWIGIV